MSIGANTTRAGSESEQSVAVRLYGARDLAFGLLLRDSTAAVVARTLRKFIFSSLEVVVVFLCHFEGPSRELILSLFFFF